MLLDCRVLAAELFFFLILRFFGVEFGFGGISRPNDEVELRLFKSLFAFSLLVTKTEALDNFWNMLFRFSGWFVGDWAIFGSDCTGCAGIKPVSLFNSPGDGGTSSWPSNEIFLTGSGDFVS